MSFHIITDSASDLPETIISKYNAYVMPTPVMVDKTDYLDGLTIHPDEFYAKQAANSEISTYHISQFMFEEHFRKFAKNKDEVLYICFSTGIAGTFNAARLAYQTILEEYPDFKLTIIDSKCASLGYGLVVSKLLNMQANGAPKELITEAANFFCSHMKHFFTVNSLEYLYKGGRISRTSAAMGSILNINPIITVNAAGSLQSIERVRGWDRTKKRLIELTKEVGNSLDKQTIGVCYGTSENEAGKVVNMLKDAISPKEVLMGRVGCAIGAHTGPSIIGIVFPDAFDNRFESYIK